MDVTGKVIILADIRSKRQALASLRPNVFEIRTGAGKRPECSVHAFHAGEAKVPPKPTR
jgi:hypothetical protein